MIFTKAQIAKLQTIQNNVYRKILGPYRPYRTFQNNYGVEGANYTREQAPMHNLKARRDPSPCLPFWDKW